MKVQFGQVEYFNTPPLEHKYSKELEDTKKALESYKPELESQFEGSKILEICISKYLNSLNLNDLLSIKWE